MTHTFNVTESGERLDSFLAAQDPSYSRSTWQKLASQGAVTIEGQPVKSSRKVVAGEQIVVNQPEAKDFSAQTMPIVYEDDDVLVVNKPAGMLSHAKGAQNDEFTVGEFMRTRTTDAADTNRPGIVHRLDRGTSGVMIAAKNPQAKRWLQKQFALRKVKKTYIALVVGHLSEPSATIKLPIERNPKKPQVFRVGGNGKPAETSYETSAVYKKYTLLTLLPHTGRTHQLRVHLQYLHCPIVGDEFYGKKEAKLGRMFLHAKTLELTLPSRERKVFEAPLPHELQQFLDHHTA